MNTDILTKFNNKKKMWISPKHPLFFEAEEDKILYGAGIFSHASFNTAVNTLNNLELARLLSKGFGFSNKEITAVIRLAKDGTRLVDEIMGMLNTRIKKYLFILDLINVCMRSTPLSDEEIQDVDIFCELLEITDIEKKLLNDFILYSFSYNTDKCIRVFEEMINQNMELTMTELKYYIPEIEYVTKIESKIIKQGTNLRLVDNCEIKDTILVPKGTTLNIVNAIIQMKGSIIVDGGTLILQDSELINRNNKNEPLIHVKSYSDVNIINTKIDCRNLGSAINQENGNLKIENSKIYNTTLNSGVKFWGSQITVTNTNFCGCFSIKNGGALLIKNGSGLIKDCLFKDCEAKKGGAIYTTPEVMIIGCKFKFCKVTAYGAAIYYKGEIKSNIMDCEYHDCYPEKEEVIQYLGGYGDKIINKEYTIQVSTILECKLIVAEMGILNIVNSVVYSINSIRCKGILNIKKSRIVALDFQERDLFVMDRAKGCSLEYSEFDGRLLAGIIWAAGTRLHINDCYFRNTAQGRAIYDAFEPYILNSIFSYCLKGAVYTCSGNLINCTFINCREKSGAGISMYGNRGIIKDCKFVRCVADYSGGGIDKTRGNQVYNCNFEECQPNDIA